MRALEAAADDPLSSKVSSGNASIEIFGIVSMLQFGLLAIRSTAEETRYIPTCPVAPPEGE